MGGASLKFFRRRAAGKEWDFFIFLKDWGLSFSGGCCDPHRNYGSQ